MTRMNRIGSKILMGLGVLLFVMACLAYLYNIRADRQAEQSAREILNRMSYIETTTETTTETTIKTADAEVLDTQSENSDRVNSHAQEDKIEEMYRQAIGVLEIPKLERRLPVLDICTPESLQYSVCRYAGEGIGKPQSLVIAGHNYKSHFAGIHQLDIGDEAAYIDLEGQIYHYRVSAVETVDGKDVERMLSGDDWDMTLFTCDYDRMRRVAIRLQQYD
ncbi:MAG: sortase [Clostridium sp.]